MELNAGTNEPGSSRPIAPGGGSTLNFSLGEQVAFPLSDTEGNRALCVRRSGE